VKRFFYFISEKTKNSTENNKLRDKTEYNTCNAEGKKKKKKKKFLKKKKIFNFFLFY